MATTTFGLVYKGKSKKGTVVNELKSAKKISSNAQNAVTQTSQTQPDPQDEANTASTEPQKVSNTEEE